MLIINTLWKFFSIFPMTILCYGALTNTIITFTINEDIIGFYRKLY